MQSPDEKWLNQLARAGFDFFRHEWNPENGLIKDAARPDAPASIAAVGLALSCYIVAVERGWMPRAEALRRTLLALRFFAGAPQSSAPDASGFHGFFYHFLDMKSGQRVWNCELSSMDTALLLAGFLTARAYFDLDSSDEREVRERAAASFGAANWNWMQNGSDAVSHGWKPPKNATSSGFLRYEWRGYSEALLLYVLGLGSETHALPQKSYAAFCEPFARQWKTIYGESYLYAGPLFIHQLPQCWLDLRGQRDDFMRARDCDYFENSACATRIQREYARRNPKNLVGYSEKSWGISASDGPGPATRAVNGKTRHFWGYRARGAPFGGDDGTLSPWAVAASLPFSPEIVVPTLRHFEKLELREDEPYGFKATFNPSFRTSNGVWTAPHQLALNPGPAILLIENWRSGLLWNLLRNCPVIRAGLTKAGFEHHALK